LTGPEPGFPFGAGSWDIDFGEYFVVRVLVTRVTNNHWAIVIGPAAPIRPRHILREASVTPRIVRKAYEVACQLHDALSPHAQILRWSSDVSDESDLTSERPIPPSE
jgi:hypothetical protein